MELIWGTLVVGRDTGQILKGIERQVTTPRRQAPPKLKVGDLSHLPS